MTRRDLCGASGVGLRQNGERSKAAVKWTFLVVGTGGDPPT
jgi:hypothetical protein